MPKARPSKKKKSNAKTFTLNRQLQKWLIGIFTMMIAAAYGWMADTATSIRYPDVNQPSLLYSTETRDDLGLTMSRAIDQAKESVTLVIYTITDPAIIKSLKNKSLENCSVKVICDAKTSPDIEQALGTNVKVIKRFIDGLMHQKILIIDGQQTWIGSANMTGASLRHHNNLVTAIDSQALALAAIAKANSYTSTDRLATLGHHTFTVGGQKLELSFLPDDNAALQRIKNLIASAKKTLRIAMFTWTRIDLAQAVIDAQKRGVEVQVAVDSNSAAGASAKVVELLKKGGVPIKFNRGGASLLHHKFMYIDSKTLVNGSANWTKAAFEKNDDCFIIMHDLTEEQSEFMNRLWKIIDSETRAR
ncbi:MAG: hypothetical protein H0U49_11970 [Parachlamydiaceae bacterium]|nr:hypothetical protein [Parachlamydiaceae bacterium]